MTRSRHADALHRIRQARTDRSGSEMSKKARGGEVQPPPDDDSIPVMLSPGIAFHDLPREALRQAAEADKTLLHASALGFDTASANEVIRASGVYFSETSQAWDWQQVRAALTRFAATKAQS